VDEQRSGDDLVPVAVPVHAVDLGGSRVLYDPRAGRAHVLNPTAARIWAMVDGTTSISSIVAALVAHTGAAPDAVDAGVRSSIERFRAEGLLVPPAVSARPADTEWPVSTTGDDGRPTTLSLLDRTVRIVTRSDRTAAALDWWAQPLRTREPASVSHDADDVVDDTTRRVLPAHLNRLAAASTALVTLHAAGVVAGDAAVVLPAAPGAGKSTLVTELVRRGLGYLSDEVVGLAVVGRAAVGYPKRITLEVGSWGLFPELDEVAERSTHPAFDPSRVRWIDARDLHANATGWRGRRLDVGLVVVPTYAPDAEPSVERVDPLDAMTALVANSFNLGSVGAAGVEALRDVALDVPCYRLVHRDVHWAADAVCDLIDEHGVA